MNYQVILMWFFMCSNMADVGVHGAPIINGDFADIRQYPYVVQIMEDDVFMCGGCLIGPTTVLTAAHCVAHYSEESYEVIPIDPSRFTIRVGSDVLYRGGKIHNVVYTKIHNYNPLLKNNDIAFMKLSAPVALDSTVSFAKLPAPGLKILEGALVTYVGWGATDVTDIYKPSPRLKQITVPVVSTEECKEWWYEKRNIIITENMICTATKNLKGEPADTCKGDSGGPVVLGGALVALTSFGFGCAMPAHPSVATYLQHYVDWIHRQSNDSVVVSAPSEVHINEYGKPTLLLVILATCGIIVMFYYILHSCYISKERQQYHTTNREMQVKYK